MAMLVQNFRLEKDDLDEIRKEAQKNNLSISEVMRRRLVGEPRVEQLLNEILKKIEVIKNGKK